MRRAALLSTSLAMTSLACGDDPVAVDDGGTATMSGGPVTSVGATSLDGPGTADDTAGTDDAAPTSSDDTGATDTGAPEGCGVPAGVDAMLHEGELLPLVPVAAAELEAIAFRRTADSVIAIAPSGEARWTAAVGTGAITGGFDFDDDGWPDIAVAHHVEGMVACGGQTIGSSWLSLWHGIDGELAADLPAADDLCWTFGATTYPTVQWTAGTLLFGASTPHLLASATYAASANFLEWDGAAFSLEPLAYPSTLNYDATYDADLPNAWGTGTSYLANSHIANGLLLDVAGETRGLFFTSGRAVQYADEPISAAQLRADRPYLTGNRTDLAGRNYGLVTVDPALPDRVALLSGTTAYSVYADMVAGAMTFDPWGQIERHVSLYDATTNTVVDRFYAYAHDNGDGNQYEGRLVYPDSPWVATAPGQPSRLAYSVYEQGHWILHVSQPGNLDDALALQGQVLWDIRDLDGDGTDEWIVSPAELPGDPDVPGYYFPRWRTDVHHFDEASLQLISVATFDDGIPELAAAFPTATHRTSMSAMYPVAVIADDDCARQLVLRTPEGGRALVPVP